MIETKMRQSLRVVLAKILEHYPKCMIVTGVFSALKDKQMKFGFFAAGEAKVKERMKLPQEEYYRAMLPIIAKEFEQEHHLKPAFIMEWIIIGDASLPSVNALMEFMSQQAEEESKLHDTAPEDIMDIDFVTHLLTYHEGANAS